MVRITLVAAVALGALMIAPVYANAQDTSQTTQIFTVMPQPEQGYGTTIYSAIPVSDQPAFINWLTGFQPDQRILVVRTLHDYSLGGPDTVAFTTDTTPVMAMPVFVKILTPTDQPTFTTFWNGLTPDQQTAFINYARDVYPNSTTTTTTTVQTPTGTQIFTTMPQPEQGYGTTIYNAIPVSDQSNFINWLNGFTPDQQIMIIRALHGYSMGGNNVTLFTTDTTPTTAMPVFVNVLTPADQPTFTTFWNGMTPDQQTAFITYARDLNSTVPTTTSTTTTVTPTTSETTSTTTSETVGSAAQPFAAQMATTFSASLAAAVQPIYMSMATDLPISELDGFNYFLSTLTPDQQALVIRALGPINDMGKKGAVAKAGMSDANVHNLLLKQLDAGDKSAFDSMWSSLNDQQITELEILTRDAYNGGLNDLGASGVGK